MLINIMGFIHLKLMECIDKDSEWTMSIDPETNNWKLFEGRLKHFAKVFHSLERNKPSREDDFAHFIADIPDCDERYRGLITRLAESLKKTSWDELKVQLRAFEKELRTTEGMGDHTLLSHIIIKAALSLSKESFSYVLYILRGGIQTFSLPASKGFFVRPGFEAQFKDVASYLFDAGFSLDYHDAEGKTLLHQLVFEKNEVFIKELIAIEGKKHPRLDLTDNIGATALHYAVWRGMYDIVADLLLLNRLGRPVGINKRTLPEGFIKKSKGKTALELAEQKGWTDIVRAIASQPDGIANTLRCFSSQNLPVLSNSSDNEIIIFENNTQSNEDIINTIETLKRDVYMLKSSNSEIRDVLTHQLTLYQSYKNACLSVDQASYYEKLSTQFILLFRDLHISPLGVSNNAQVLPTMAIKDEDAHRKNLKGGAVSILDTFYEKTNKVFRNGSFGFLSALGSETFREVSAGFSLAGVATGFVSKKVSNARNNKSQEALEKAREWFGKNNPQTLEIYAQHLALEMARRMKDILELIPKTELDNFVDCGAKRLAACVLSGEFDPEDSFENILIKMCGFSAKQDKKLFGLLKISKNIRLCPKAMEAKFNSTLEFVDENILHLGFEYFVKELGFEEGKADPAKNIVPYKGFFADKVNKLLWEQLEAEKQKREALEERLKKLEELRIPPSI